jgi:hypothetical protein
LRYLLSSPVVDRTDGRQEAALMTFKMERQVNGHTTTFRLIGHLRAAHLEALKAHMASHRPRTVLDLDQVMLVDVAVVRFLAGCEAAGMAVLHGPPYIREWIRREQDRPG